MKITKKSFLNKWSTWWILDGNKEGLDRAFEGELDELINPKNPITRKELLDRGFTYRYWHGDDDDEVFHEYFLELEKCDLDEIVVDIINEAVELVDGTKHYPMPNCKTIAHLDNLIYLFKTS